MNYQQAAQTAIDCQNASNLSGVVKSLAGPVMDALWAEARRTGKGTDWINQHPIVTLFLDKLASLNRSQFADSLAFSRAYDAVQQAAQSTDELAEKLANQMRTNLARNVAAERTEDTGTLEVVRQELQKDAAREQLFVLMRKYANLGAHDSEARDAMHRVEYAAADGKPFPLMGRNPFQLYDSLPGWETASLELVTAAQSYWKALVQEKLGIIL